MSSSVRLDSLVRYAALALTAGVLLWANGEPARAAGVIEVGDSAGDVGYSSSLVLDAGGNPVVSYVDANGNLKLLHCSDPQCSAGNSIAVVEIDAEHTEETSLALAAGGNPVISYQSYSGPRLTIVRCGNPACTQGNTSESPTPAIVNGGDSSLVLDASGYPVVSYHDALYDEVEVLHCGNATCTAGNTTATLDELIPAGAGTSLALDASGNPAVAYFDDSSGDVKVVRCGDASCTSGNTVAVIDDAGFNGGSVSLALDGGIPVVAYHDDETAGPDYLKVARCGNATCTSGNTLATPDEAGSDTSIALDANGNPVVSYRLLSSGELRVLVCGNASCASGNSTVSPGGAGSGIGASLALDKKGNPVVSYRALTALAVGELRVLHCSLQDCSTPKPPSGDVNCNGRVDSIDAALVLQSAAGLIDQLPCNVGFKDDPDCNGRVNAIDAALILQYIAGLLGRLPVC